MPHLSVKAQTISIFLCRKLEVRHFSQRGVNTVIFVNTLVDDIKYLQGKNEPRFLKQFRELL